MDLLAIAPEVGDAIASGRPVVALESTIITHGMPYPDNLSMAGEVERIVLPRCAAPAWQAMVGMGKPLSELATLRPQDLVPLGYRLGAAARSVSDVVEWLGEWRPQLRRLLAAGGMVPSG